MNDFEFHSPTRIIFGRNAIPKTGEAVRAAGARKVLLHFGGNTIVRSGLLDQVRGALSEAGVEWVELGGVKPNPRLSLVRDGIRLCKEHDVDFILAVGGGSPIDSAKAIAAGVLVEHDVWDFFTGQAAIEKALPLGVVLTIPAAGSEASSSTVVTDEENKLKRGAGANCLRPVFAVMDPTVTFSLPNNQTLNGVSDIMAHILERYFTNVQYNDFTDRLCEATMKTLIHNLPIVLNDPRNYEARAEIMWASTLAHNDLLSTGRIGDWASHSIEHELSGEYDVAHGAGLSVVFPAWMKYVYRQRLEQFIKFAMRVWDVEYDFDQPERTAREGIARFEAFYQRMGMPTRLSDLNIGSEKLELMARRARYDDDGLMGNFVRLDKDDVLAIYRLAL